ncbi:hypothetical protein K7432_005693 [Basidiobolus ranarum]|uniref:Protein YIP n=1 Tax=Basidiobolus ranarum TaxID=34480 RepID=A0ABR2W2T2_9FUNG
MNQQSFDLQNFEQYPDNSDHLQFYQTSYDDGSYAMANHYTPPDDLARANYERSLPIGSFWSAFGTGGSPEEPPLLEELGIDLLQIKDRTIVALNPFKPMDRDLMENPDLAGPLLFCFSFGMFLMLSGKAHFEYIYGVGVLGCLSIYAILNLMSEAGIDGYCTASVLGYCLLPMVILSSSNLLFHLSGAIGMIATALIICWCTFSSSHMFVTVLSMKQQVWLISYPIGLFYAAFALMTMF